MGGKVAGHRDVDEPGHRRAVSKVQVGDHALVAVFLAVVEMLEGRVIPREVTQVSPGSTVGSLRSIYTATLLRDFYIQGADLDIDRVPANVRNIVLATEKLIRDCSADNDGELLISYINAIANQMTSFLQPEELARIWRRFEEVGCTDAWSDRLRRWFALFKAVSARDAPRMAALSTQLLESGDDAAHARRLRYLVATSMLGHLSIGDRRGAMQAWSKYGSSEMESGDFQAAMRLLVTFSTS